MHQESAKWLRTQTNLNACAGWRHSNEEDTVALILCYGEGKNHRWQSFRWVFRRERHHSTIVTMAGMTVAHLHECLMAAAKHTRANHKGKTFHSGEAPANGYLTEKRPYRQAQEPKHIKSTAKGGGALPCWQASSEKGRLTKQVPVKDKFQATMLLLLKFYFSPLLYLKERGVQWFSVIKHLCLAVNSWLFPDERKSWRFM